MRHLAIALLVVAACKHKQGVSVEVEPDHAAHLVANWLADQGVTASVSCPPHVAMIDGTSFECVGRLVEVRDTFGVPVDIVLRDGLELVPRGVAVARDKLVAAIREQAKLDGDVVASCDKVLYQVGEIGSCTFSGGGHRGHVAVKGTTFTVTLDN